MPADYRSTAEGLAVSPSRQDSPSPSPPPPWARRLSSSSSPAGATTTNSASHRLSNPRLHLSSSSSSGFNNSNSAWAARYRFVVSRLESVNTQVMRTFWRMTPLQRVLAGFAVILGYALIILGWIYSHRFFGWLAGVSESWRELRGGWLIVFALVFVSGFPPMIGYSTANTIAGFVYGFPWGWPIVAVACVAGSLCAFFASRTVLSRYVDRMVGKDPRFVALGQVLKRDGIWYLTGIRFSPLPFSMSNGFLATIPSITPSSFALATALSSPKLMVHVFIGSRLAILAESGDKMSLGDRMINYFSMAMSAAIGIAIGWVVYRRTMARAAEVARETAAEEGHSNRAYLDTEDTMIDPEDAAALMSDDDLSLWETQVNDEGGYRDEFDEDWSSSRDNRNKTKPAGRDSDSAS